MLSYLYVFFFFLMSVDSFYKFCINLDACTSLVHCNIFGNDPHVETEQTELYELLFSLSKGNEGAEGDDTTKTIAERSEV